MKIVQTTFNGDQNVGLYGVVTEKYFLTGLKINKNPFNVKQKVITIMDTSFVGIFCAGNSDGLVVPKTITEEELKRVEKITSVLVLDTNYTALGNLILMNDHGIIISRLIKKKKGELKDFFGLNIDIMKIGSMNLVGSAGYATNNGCLVQPKLKNNQKANIKKILKVNVDIGTVSFGSPFVASGLLANTKGLIVSEQTSGPELQRITEVFSFI